MKFEKRHLNEKETMEALIEMMPEQERIEYLTYKYLRKEVVSPGRVLVVYTIRNGKPSDIETLRFGEFALGVKETPTVRIHVRGDTQIITPTPSRIATRDAFLLIPPAFELCWKGREVNGELEFHAQYAILIKTRSRENIAIEGQTYCISLARFFDAYPEIEGKLRY